MCRILSEVEFHKTSSAAAVQVISYVWQATKCAHSHRLAYSKGESTKK